MEILQSGPQSSTFIPLAEHQSQTPASFYSGPPVLHYHSPNCTILIQSQDLTSSSPLSSLAPADAPATNGHAADGEDNDKANHEVSIKGVDVWVTSQKLLLWSTQKSSGVSIPYPSISLHAIQRLPVPEAESTQSGLYMQLVASSSSPENPSGEDDDEDLDTLSLTLIPAAAHSPTTEDPTAPEGQDDQPQQQQSPTDLLFSALSACSNLHPDPANVGDDNDEGEDGGSQIQGSSLFAAGLIQPGNSEGGLPPPMPGSGGWITAQNVGEYFDEEGNWIGGDDDGDEQEVGEATGELGPGAGTVRAREEDEDGDGAATAADGDGEDGETKWRRTG